MAEVTLADHAEHWWRTTKGKNVPARGSVEWKRMCEAWVDWAFADLHNQKKRRCRKAGP